MKVQLARVLTALTVTTVVAACGSAPADTSGETVSGPADRTTHVVIDATSDDTQLRAEVAGEKPKLVSDGVRCDYSTTLTPFLRIDANDRSAPGWTNVILQWWNLTPPSAGRTITREETFDPSKSTMRFYIDAYDGSQVYKYNEPSGDAPSACTSTIRGLEGREIEGSVTCEHPARDGGPAQKATITFRCPLRALDEKLH